MTHWILPASGGAGEVGEVLQYPAVDVFDRKSLGGSVLYCHEDEAAEGVGRFAAGTCGQVVGRLAGLRGWRRRGGGLTATVSVLQGADAAQARVAQAGQQIRALVQPAEAGQLLILGPAEGGRQGQREVSCLGVLVELTQTPRHTPTAGALGLLPWGHDHWTHAALGSCRDTRQHSVKWLLFFMGILF